MVGTVRTLLVAALAVACSSGAEPEPAAARVSTRPTRLTIVHSSDLHSHAFPFRDRVTRFEASYGLGAADSIAEVGGLARLAAELARLRTEHAPLIYLDSGDALEGTAIFERYRGEPEFRALSGMGLAAMGLGNHELSLGAADLATLIQERAQFPVLATNLGARPGSALSKALSSSVVIELAGLQVGVLSAVNESSPPGLDQPGNDLGVEVLQASNALQVELDRLAPQVDLLVVLSHLGLEGDRELVARTSGIDLLLGGHQHIATAEPLWVADCEAGATRTASPHTCSARQVAIVHSGAYGKRLSHLELELGSEDEKEAGRRLVGLSLSALPITADLAEQPEIRALLEPYRDRESALAFAFVPKRLERRSALGADTPLGNFIADLLRESSAADVAVLNGSALRTDLEAGASCHDDFSRALPFADDVEVAVVTGAELNAALTHAAELSAARGCEAQIQLSGLRWTVDCAACKAPTPRCSQLRHLGGQGAPVASEERLRLAVPSYLTRPAALFAGLFAATPAVLEVGLSELVWQGARKLPPLSSDTVPSCVASLVRLASGRCESSFGASECPLSTAAARHFCEAAPAWFGERDGRITMLGEAG